MSPVLLDNNFIKAPKDAEDYTLAYFILSKKNLTEKSLVNIILGLYILSGLLAITIFYLGNVLY